MNQAAVSTALRYGAERFAAGADSKTLLVGWRGRQALFALAAGLAREQDRDRFAVLARYLLRRDKADGYWLLSPADLAGVEQLVAESAGPEGVDVQCALMQRDASGGFMGLGATASLAPERQLGDLLDGGGTLPAVMRRELDRLAQALALPLPTV